MGLFDNVPDPAPDPDRVRPRRDPVKLVRQPEAPAPQPVSRLKSLLWTFWYWITRQYP
jgi:hypothetical protein